ncbi:hypothetical protein MTR_4g115560 [Medicago truncatula]|uniref:Uncharacterized protein n=1 Tax=Medicago truncatula TaxID=3880 RepID=G7JFE7_MEDTR|nr:hypothetical protein MTR_4g115560 [Medicago truncatula]
MFNKLEEVRLMDNKLNSAILQGIGELPNSTFSLFPTIHARLHYYQNSVSRITTINQCFRNLDSRFNPKNIFKIREKLTCALKTQVNESNIVTFC